MKPDRIHWQLTEVYHNDENSEFGVILRLKKCTITLRTDDGLRWRASPMLLHRNV